ncbi:MAG: hypothetical protein ACPGUX_10500 [Halocynthiibacter sp.]
MNMKSVFSTCALMCMVGTAQAGNVTPPEGCNAFLTVQSVSCEVEHYWSCESDPAGVKWRYVLNQDGPTYVSQVDSEYRWLFSENLISGRQEFMGKPEKDSQSMSDLLGSGVDSYDFVQVLNFPGRGVLEQHITGFDRLNGADAVIDGQALLGSDYELREVTGGEEVFEVRGQEYVLEEFNLFLGGRGEFRNNQEAWTSYNQSPVSFARPGETGFLTDTPLFGCGEILSALDVPLQPAG